jgi:hypothetical protein
VKDLTVEVLDEYLDRESSPTEEDVPGHWLGNLIVVVFT